jgi:FkbM family methyltransferase
MAKLRYVLKDMTAGMTLRIKAGPLAGMRWGMFAGRRFIRGDYSKRVIPMFLDLLKPGDVVYDVGAHVGYYAICAAQKVGAAGQVVAFEPAPINVKFLRNHLRLNDVRNVQLIEAGVSDAMGKARFDSERGTGRGRLDDRGDRAIDIVTLDELCKSGEIRPPNVIKMDIEGAETKALHGARETLARHHPAVFVSLHGPEAQQECPALLEALGYQIKRLGRADILATAR